MAMHAGIWTIRGYGLWAVELRATGELIGRAGVWFPEGWPEIEAGWMISHEHWAPATRPRPLARPSARRSRPWE
jgi:hypothetical protein